MKKLSLLIVTLLFIALCINVFGQNKSYPFLVTKTGQGKQAIIFIPGFACSGDVWNETKTFYEKEYTCYVLTMPGFAGVKAKAGSSFKTWEADIAAFIKETKLEKSILIGHSMGGGLAMAIAADYPELVQKIVVVDALPCLQALSNPTFKSNDKNDCSEIVSKMTSTPDEQFYQMQKKSIGRLLEDSTKHELVVGWSLKSDRKTFGEMYCDFSNTDLREKIATIKCPSLILMEAYFINFERPIKEQFKKLETANIQFANKGLHFIMFDDKDWYLKQLEGFIKTT